MPAESLRTMALRASDDVHTKLTALAQIQGISLNDAMLRAVEDYMEKVGKDPKVIAKLQEMENAVQREADERLAALASLRQTVTGPTPKSAPPRAGTPKTEPSS